MYSLLSCGGAGTPDLDVSCAARSLSRASPAGSLAELVKISQYRRKPISTCLMSARPSWRVSRMRWSGCVNAVGVDLNTASVRATTTRRVSAHDGAKHRRGAMNGQFRTASSFIEGEPSGAESVWRKRCLGFLRINTAITAADASTVRRPIRLSRTHSGGDAASAKRS